MIFLWNSDDICVLNAIGTAAVINICSQEVENCSGLVTKGFREAQPFSLEKKEVIHLLFSFYGFILTLELCGILLHILNYSWSICLIFCSSFFEFLFFKFPLQIFTCLACSCILEVQIFKETITAFYFYVVTIVTYSILDSQFNFLDLDYWTTIITSATSVSINDNNKTIS